MYYVYILVSEKDGKLYIGSTPDLKSRIAKHKQGYVKATKNRQPLSLIYYEAYISRRDAKRREIFLKGGKGHDELKIQLGKIPSVKPNTNIDIKKTFCCLRCNKRPKN